VEYDKGTVTELCGKKCETIIYIGGVDRRLDCTAPKAELTN